MFLCILFSVPFLGAHYSYTQNLNELFILIDTIQPRLDSLFSPSDSIKLPVDSLSSDSAKQNKNALDAIVDYSAQDSIILTADKWGYLYGESEVKYTDLVLKGEIISMNMDSSLVYANAGVDSVGKEFGFPVFSDKGTELESKTMKYNFKTKKGYATGSITNQGEGYVVAGRAKKNDDNSFFMREGKYTTCEDHEHPHFYLALTKAKVKPKKNVVTGPAYLVIEGLPLPIGLPFGFFPFSEKYSSGVIMPSYGDEMERGFNLRGGGYYFAINDNIDLALTGEIYTKGSWGLNARSNYRKRYKYSGGFDLGYLVTKTGEKDVNYSVAKDLRINWTHAQDPKSNMFRTISANVNFSTSSYDRNDLNMAYTPAGTSNTKSSSVNITQRIPNSPWSLSASMNIAQRSRDSTISLTLPNLMITMSRIQPFKKKMAAGSERWYEKIQMSYSGEFRNSIDTKEDKLLTSNFQKDWRNGFKHSIPVSATFSAFDHLNITPSINYTERWYTSKINKGLNDDGEFAPLDTVSSVGRAYDFSAALSFQTMLYGMYTPIFSKSTKIRHVFSPSISFSYNPDFSDPMWGMYKESDIIDSYGRYESVRWSPYEKGMFGVPSPGAAGMISFNFDNNLEMKVASEKDSTGFKKISLIDNLSINFSKNLMADSLKWSDIAVNLRLKFSKSFVVNLGAAFDPYMYQKDEYGRVRQVDQLRIKNGKGFGKLKSTGYSISPSINQDTFKKWFGKDKDKKDSENTNEGSPPNSDLTAEATEHKGSLLEGKKDDKEYDEDGYVKNAVTWNLGMNFSMNYSWDQSRITEKGKYVEYKGRLTKTFGLNGSLQPTRNWNFSFNANYDFDAKKIAYMSCNLTRNLHCWSITASFNPVGPYKSYFVSLRASSSMLQDLKYEQRGRSSSYDPHWD